MSRPLSQAALALAAALATAPGAASRELRRTAGLTRNQTSRAWHELSRAGLLPEDRVIA